MGASALAKHRLVCRSVPKHTNDVSAGRILRDCGNYYVAKNEEERYVFRSFAVVHDGLEAQLVGQRVPKPEALGEPECWWKLVAKFEEESNESVLHADTWASAIAKPDES